MSIIVGVLAAVLATSMPGQEVHQAMPDTGIPLPKELVLDQIDEARSARAAVAIEERLPAWAESTEARLRRLYGDVDAVDAATLRVICKTAWCEIVGRSRGDRADSVLKAGLQRMNTNEFRNRLLTDHLHGDVMTATSNDQPAPFHFVFAAYWHRV